jgi:hypothetical protein
MVEVSERQNFEQAVLLASPEYREITKLENLDQYQQLYKLRVLEDVSDIYMLGDGLGIRFVGEVARMKRTLENYLKLVCGGQFNPRMAAELVCPNCFMPSLVDTSKRGGDEIKKSCSACGMELPDSFADFQVFSQDLDFGVTFAPVSTMNDTDGAGGTFHPNNTREVRDHKPFLYNIVNADNIPLQAFAKISPEIAAQFTVANGLSCSNVVFDDGLVELEALEKRRDEIKAELKDNPYNKELREEYKTIKVKAESVLDTHFAYCVVDGFVRKVKLGAYRGFWHQFDSLRRLSILTKGITFKGPCAKEKVYGISLCKRYGFGEGNNDQAMINTLGLQIDKYKPLVERRDKHLNFHTFVDTLFFRLLCVFDKSGQAVKAQSELKIDRKLLKFIDCIDDIYKADAESLEEEGSLLVKALVKVNGARVALPPNQ